MIVLSRLLKVYLPLAVGLLLAIVCTYQQRVSLQVPTLYQFECSIAGARPSSKTFAVYFPSDWKTREIGQNLCSELLVGSDFGRVLVSWAPRETIVTDTLLSKQYQLLWNRPHVLKGLLPGYQELYAQLEPLSDYDIYWFSNDADFEISQQYLDNHRLGLLADSKSQSGHQIPLTEINQRNLRINSENLIYYPNRELLVEDFLLGKIDLMPNVKLLPPLQDWPENKQRKIATSSMGGWFVDRSVNAGLHCAIRSALADMAPLSSQDQPPC